MSQPVVDALAASRERTFAIVAHLDDDQLERQIDPIMSPLAWDLAHIAAYEDLWLVHRFAGEPLLHPELAARYDAFETPRAVRGEIELLDADGAREYLSTCASGRWPRIDARGIDPVVHEMVVRHELQHTETMRQAMRLGGLLAPGEPGAGHLQRRRAGRVARRARGPRRARRRRTTCSPTTTSARATASSSAPSASRAARSPTRPGCTSPRAAATSAASGGATRAGRGRRTTTSRSCPDAEAGHPDAPVCHVSWFEADAFARSRGARLPTEAEWEKAATWTQGDLEGIGQVWEWTTSWFGGYPGFVAHPYREYSEVFFGTQYRVLRGGSWATDPRVATLTFRNWDLPQRRQIFAGVRLATDPEES